MEIKVGRDLAFILRHLGKTGIKKINYLKGTIEVEDEDLAKAFSSIERLGNAKLFILRHSIPYILYGYYPVTAEPSIEELMHLILSRFLSSAMKLVDTGNRLYRVFLILFYPENENEIYTLFNELKQLLEKCKSRKTLPIYTQHLVIAEGRELEPRYLEYVDNRLGTYSTILRTIGTRRIVLGYAPQGFSKALLHSYLSRITATNIEI